MTYRVEIAPAAYDELDEAFSWISKDSPAAAARWRDGLFDALRSLRELPKRCALAPENDAFVEEIRQLLYGKRPHAYRILFNIDGVLVQILHVRHGARRHLPATPSKAADD